MIEAFSFKIAKDVQQEVWKMDCVPSEGKKEIHARDQSFYKGT